MKILIICLRISWCGVLCRSCLAAQVQRSKAKSKELLKDPVCQSFYEAAGEKRPA